MGTARKLEEVHRELALLERQGKVVEFLANTENAQRINGLVEDIRHAMMDYQVCAPNYSLLPCLTNALDFTATRYLRQELSAHCGFHRFTFRLYGLTSN